MAETILSSPFFLNAVLPFLLLFTILFAVLQKTKVLGEGKRQIDAIASLVIALIVISFANAVNIINALLPFLAVSLVIIIVFMLLFGMFFHGHEFKINDRLRMWGGILAAIAVTVAVLVITGAWNYLVDFFFSSDGGSATLANLIFVGIIIGAVVVVMNSAKTGGSDN